MKLPERDTPLPSTEAFYGGLPTGWTERRLRFLCQIIPSNVDKHSRDDELPVEICNYTDVYYNDRITLGIQFMEATATPEQIARFGLQAGDTVITKDSETADDIGIPAFVPNTLPGVVCGYHLTILRPGSGVEGRFIHWLFQAAPMRSRLETLATGLTRVGLSQQALKDLVVPLPSLDEQRRIAAFLDHETARIDELVREQEWLVGLLTEKLRIVQNRLTTTGRLGDTKGRGVGRERFVGAPPHWRIEKLTWHLRAHKGKNAQLYTEAYCKDNPGPYPVFSGQTENDGVIGRIDSFDYDFDEGVLLVTTVGSKERVMTVKHIRGRFSLSQNCMILVPFSDVDVRFLLYQLQTLFNEERERLPRYMQYSFRVEDLGKFWVGLPPLEEALSIARSLDKAQTYLEELTGATSRLRELLLERRSALISAAVTGQLDLSDWQLPEPEAVAEVA